MEKQLLVNNQRGSVLNVALLILILVTLIVVFLNRSSTTDVKIAANIKSEQTNFYRADSGVDAGSEVLEQNFNCSMGFSANYPVGAPIHRRIGDMLIDQNSLEMAYSTVMVAPATDTTRTMYMPYDYAAGAPHTNLSIGPVDIDLMDEIISDEMHAGYEGLGIGQTGGMRLGYDIYSTRVGLNNSAKTIWLRWIHIVGMEGECVYY